MGLTDDFLTIEEAAELFGVHAGTIRRLLRDRTLRGRKMMYGTRMRWLVSRRDLLDRWHPNTGYALEYSGPKLYLTRATVEDQEDEDDDDD